MNPDMDRGATVAETSSREMTVNEFLAQKIEVAQRRVDALREIKDHLNTAFLRRGCSAIAHLLPGD